MRSKRKCFGFWRAWQERKMNAAKRRCRRRSPSSLAKLAQCQGALRVHLLQHTAEEGRAGHWRSGECIVVTLPPFSSSIPSTEQAENGRSRRNAAACTRTNHKRTFTGLSSFAADLLRSCATISRKHARDIAS